MSPIPTSDVHVTFTGRALVVKKYRSHKELAN